MVVHTLVLVTFAVQVALLLWSLRRRFMRDKDRAMHEHFKRLQQREKRDATNDAR